MSKNYDELQEHIKEQDEALARKNKEIDKLIRRLMATKYRDNIPAQTRPYEEFEGKSLYEISQIYRNQVRKQVCNEIREKLKKLLDVDLLNINDCYHRNLPSYIFAEILDQIEKRRERIMNEIYADKRDDVLVESGSVSKYDLHYRDAIVFMKDRIIRELMHRFYHDYLQSGKEYKCKLRIEATNEEESYIRKITGRLYVKECEEEGEE